jgi:hypothetical protein
MNRNGMPIVADLGPDPEPLSSERYARLLAQRQPRFAPPARRRFQLHPLAVVPEAVARPERRAELAHA